MNPALYLLNALAMVAVVSFHFFASAPDAQVHVNLRDWVARPVAQRAGMHEQHQVAAMGASAPALIEELAQTPARRLDRYTF